jgi:hypothetical protein
MSKNLKRCASVLSLVSRIRNKRLRDLILKEISCDDHIYDALSEITVNTLKGNVPLTESQKKKLRRQKRFMSALSCDKNKVSLRKRKYLVQQSGGYLATVLPVIVTLLSELLSK